VVPGGDLRARIAAGPFRYHLHARLSTLFSHTTRHPIQSKFPRGITCKRASRRGPSANTCRLRCSSSAVVYTSPAHPRPDRGRVNAEKPLPCHCTSHLHPRLHPSPPGAIPCLAADSVLRQDGTHDCTAPLSLRLHSAILVTSAGFDAMASKVRAAPSVTHAHPLAAARANRCLSSSGNTSWW
jgi:hypothetical protein